MQNLGLADNSYEAIARNVRTERGIELDAFQRVTRALGLADRDKNFPAFCRALNDNRQLWTLLAVDVADQANRLPAQLRAQIFYLAEFTDTQTSKILNGDAGVDALVEINMSVMRGLKSEVPGA